jgi:hypothetical protein
MAMVEMTSIEGMLWAIQNLKGLNIKGKELHLKVSKQDGINGSHINDPSKKSSIWEFSESSYNRFTSSDKRTVKKFSVTPPSKVLSFWNVLFYKDDEETAEKIKKTFEEEKVPKPLKVKILKETYSNLNVPNATKRKICSGLLEFESQDESVEALIFCNNMRILHGSQKAGKDEKGFIMKLDFSGLQNNIPEHFEKKSVIEEQLEEKLV